MRVILCDSPSWKLYDPRMHCSLSMIYLAAAVRAAGHDVSVADAHLVTSWDGKSMTVHKDKLEPCDVLGISATTANVNLGAALAREWPAKHKVLGGRHVTDIFEGKQERFKRSKYFQGFDYIMAGECEESLVKFCNVISLKEFGLIDGLYSLKMGETPVLMGRLPFPALPDVTKLPTPGFDLYTPGFAKGGLKNHMPLSRLAADRLTATLYNARGCPYGCKFCSDARTKMREETLEQVTAQAKLLASLGIGAIRIADDVFTIKEKRAMAIADILYDHGMVFRGTTRVNLRSPGLFKHLAQKNCSELGFGVEHASLKMLKLMDKGTTPEANEAGVKMCQDAGIGAVAFLILGFPGETNETIDEVKTWLLKVRPDRVLLSIFQPYPGTHVYNFPGQHGVTIPEDCFERMWQFDNHNTEDELVLDLPTITKKDLLRGYAEIGKLIDEEIAPRDRRVDCV